MAHAVNFSDIECMEQPTAMLEFSAFIQIKFVVWVWVRLLLVFCLPQSQRFGRAPLPEFLLHQVTCRGCIPSLKQAPIFLCRFQGILSQVTCDSFEIGWLEKKYAAIPVRLPRYLIFRLSLMILEERLAVDAG